MIIHYIYVVFKLYYWQEFFDVSIEAWSTIIMNATVQNFFISVMSKYCLWKKVKEKESCTIT